MTYKEWEELARISYNFYDTIDFKKYFPHCKRFNVREFMRTMEEVSKTWPEGTIPAELENELFDVITEDEFAEYLKKRYGVIVNWVTVDYYYIYNDGGTENDTN